MVPDLSGTDRQLYQHSTGLPWHHSVVTLVPQEPTQTAAATATAAAAVVVVVVVLVVVVLVVVVLSACSAAARDIHRRRHTHR